jgi:hypothetical protein
LPGGAAFGGAWPAAPKLLTVSYSDGNTGPVRILLYFGFYAWRFGDRSKAWFWALNGAAGVLALALAMHWGFSAVAYLGAAGYVVAWVALR